MDEKGDEGIGIDDDEMENAQNVTEQAQTEDKQELTETTCGHDVQKSENTKIYPIENARHDYSVDRGNPNGYMLTTAMADKPAQRESLRDKLAAMKERVAGGSMERGLQKDRGKAETL